MVSLEDPEDGTEKAEAPIGAGDAMIYRVRYRDGQTLDIDAPNAKRMEAALERGKARGEVKSWKKLKERTMRKRNPKRRMTKLQRLQNAARKSKHRRITESAKKLVESVVGRGKATGARVTRNPGGSITVKPIRRRR